MATGIQKCPWILVFSRKKDGVAFPGWGGDPDWSILIPILTYGHELTRSQVRVTGHPGEARSRVDLRIRGRKWMDESSPEIC